MIQLAGKDAMECIGTQWLVASGLTLLIVCGTILLMAYAMLAYTVQSRRAPQQTLQQPQPQTRHAEAPLHSPPDHP